MKYNVGEIYPQFDFEITGASYTGCPVDNTVMFVSKKVGHLVENLKGHKNCLVFAENGIEVSEEIRRDNGFVFTDNPSLEYARFANILAEREFEAEKTKKYKPVDGYYVGENVEIGENAYIEPGCVIGHGVKIGNSARIFAGAIIKNAVIGDNFYCNENAVIGTQSFTMADDEQGNKFRIPALGKVLIGNNVEIGVGDNISRGTCGNTILEDYVKLDVLVHVGHDAHLHKNVEITAGCIIGGFADLAEKAYMGINSAVKNRKNIGQKAIIGMGAVVIRDVEDNKTVIGNPAKPLIKN